MRFVALTIGGAVLIAANIVSTTANADYDDPFADEVAVIDQVDANCGGPRDGMPKDALGPDDDTHVSLGGVGGLLGLNFYNICFTDNTNQALAIGELGGSDTFFVGVARIPGEDVKGNVEIIASGATDEELVFINDVVIPELNEYWFTQVVIKDGEDLNNSGLAFAGSDIDAVECLNGPEATVQVNGVIKDEGNAREFVIAGLAGIDSETGAAGGFLNVDVKTADGEFFCRISASMGFESPITDELMDSQASINDTVNFDDDSEIEGVAILGGLSNDSEDGNDGDEAWLIQCYGDGQHLTSRGNVVLIGAEGQGKNKSRGEVAICTSGAPADDVSFLNLGSSCLGGVDTEPFDNGKAVEINGDEDSSRFGDQI